MTLIKLKKFTVMPLFAAIICSVPCDEDSMDMGRLDCTGEKNELLNVFGDKLNVTVILNGIRSRIMTMYHITAYEYQGIRFLIIALNNKTIIIIKEADILISIKLISITIQVFYNTLKAINLFF